MMRMKRIALSALTVAAVAAGALYAQQGRPKIAESKARATALARVPGGKVRSEELENEKGRLIYSFELVVAGKPGIQEVNVDAHTGKVVSVEHEER